MNVLELQSHTTIEVTTTNILYSGLFSWLLISRFFFGLIHKIIINPTKITRYTVYSFDYSET